MTVRELITLLGFKLNDAPLKKYEKGIDSAKAKSNNLEKAAKGIGTAYKIAAVAAGVAVGWISKNILDATSEMEQYRNQLQKFTGDAEGAATLLAELRDTSADPLFGTGNVVNAYKQLRNLGMEAESASGFINVLGDIADGSTENFNALSSVLTRVSVSGKVNEGTIRQLTNAGFSMQDMAESLGKSTAQLDADIKAGRIGFNELTLAMSNATKEGGRFYQNMERQARTLSGSLKILKSTLGDIGEAIGTKVLPKIVDTIRYITDLIKLGREGFINFGAKAFEALINAIQDVIIFFQILQMRMKKFGGAFTPLKAIFEDVFGFLGSVIESAYPFLMNLATLILVTFKPIQAFVRPVLESLKPIIKTVFGFLADVLGEIISIVDGMTPYFKRLGEIIGQTVEKLLPLIENVKNTLLAAFKPIKAFLKPIIESLVPLFEKVFGAIGGLFSQAGEDTKGLAGIIESLTPLFSVLGNIVSVFVDIFGTGLAWIIDTFGPFLKYILIIIGAIKAWSIVQGILNVVMTMNPIGAIIMAVVALIAIIGLLVKNWDKVVAAFKKAFEAIGNFFKKIWDGIKSFFAKLVDFVKKNFLNIINVILAIMFLPAAIVMAVVRLIIKHWDTIKAALVKVFTFVADKAKAIWGAIVNVVKVIVDKIKQIWGAIKDFFGGLWNGIKNVAGKAWDGIKSAAGKAWEGIKETASKAWEGMKNVAGRAWEGMKNGAATARDFISDRWNDIKDAGGRAFNFLDNISGGALSRMRDGFLNTINNIKEFFVGLWNALKEGPAAAFEYIKNAFIGLFDSIKEKFLGFINVIRDGWEKVKGFFGGVRDGVVNFFTGGGGGREQPEARRVNDMIITPDGNYSTHPADTIMAMQNPGDIIDALMRFLGGGMQPAYAGAGGSSLSGNALSRAASQSTYNNSNTSNVSNVTAPISVNVNASGMSLEAASAAVQNGVQKALQEAINSSRGVIPSPEARRG